MKLKESRIAYTGELNMICVSRLDSYEPELSRKLDCTTGGCYCDVGDMTDDEVKVFLAREMISMQMQGMEFGTMHDELRKIDEYREMSSGWNDYASAAYIRRTK